ncbi:biotin--[acetyl-CoA-carboxylase] ligase [Secundilactobacillus hailunensis]|uniref:Biotin--[acetyl-CoA-carboxylase] ligase n=1 Tax=Secundilactobacillus hailunensis TaxID=2559923 RepID=A0ABW1TDJ1_9LACO|nr:biotin--[acetyl-CoA-carboxylase] ligase [Secundilactobacillus hailunensis]
MDDTDIENALNTQIDTKISLLHVATIGSTNQYAKQLCEQAARQTPDVIWADQQTAGVGKFSRPFYSAANGGLYTTLIMPDLTIDAPKVGLFTTSLATATVSAIQDCFKLTVDVKWVNDIYLHDRKIAGILVEQGAHGAIIIGIGINLFQSSFPNDIQNIAGNLLSAVPTETVRQRFFITLISQLYQSCFTYTNLKFLSEYKRHLMLMGHQIQLQLGQSLITGTVSDVNHLGQLVIVDATTHQPRTIPAGEVIKVFP